jgi:hypothetical protein
MDYFKAAKLIHESQLKNYTFQLLFDVCQLQIPELLFKYGSLSNNPNLDNRKIDTLARSENYTAAISSLNDPFDCRSFFHGSDALLEIPEMVPIRGKLFVYDGQLDTPFRLTLVRHFSVK